MQISWEMIVAAWNWFAGLGIGWQFALLLLLIVIVCTIRRYCRIELSGEVKLFCLKFTITWLKAKQKAAISYRILGCNFNRELRIVPTGALIQLLLVNNSGGEITSARVELMRGAGFDPHKVIREQHNPDEKYFMEPDDHGGQKFVYSGSAKTIIQAGTKHAFSGYQVEFKTGVPYWIEIPYAIRFAGLSEIGTLKVNYFDLLGGCIDRLKNEKAYIPPA